MYFMFPLLMTNNIIIFPSRWPFVTIWSCLFGTIVSMRCCRWRWCTTLPPRSDVSRLWGSWPGSWGSVVVWWSLCGHWNSGIDASSRRMCWYPGSHLRTGTTPTRMRRTTTTSSRPTTPTPRTRRTPVDRQEMGIVPAWVRPRRGSPATASFAGPFRY